MYGAYHYILEDDNAFSIARSCAAQAQAKAIQFYEAAERVKKYEEGLENYIEDFEERGDKYAVDAMLWYRLARSYSGTYSANVLDYPAEPSRNWVEPGYVGDGFSSDYDEYHPVHGYPDEPFYNDYDYDADEGYGDEPDEYEAVYCPVCGEEMFGDICDTCEENDERL